MHSYLARVLSSVIIITQSDTRNIEYGTDSLKKSAVITRSRNTFTEIVATSERYLIINLGVKEATVPNMTSREIS